MIFVMVLTAIHPRQTLCGQGADLQVAMQTSLFGSGEVVCADLTASPQPLDDRSSVTFQPGWLRGSDVVFEQLRDQLPWRAMERPMYDRVVAVPRLICTVEPRSFDASHPLAVITVALENALQTRFSTVGANFYRTAHDSVAWHRDRIRKTARPTTVALVSLGSPRTFAVRPHATHPSKTAETTRITPATRFRWHLGHGDLLIMSGRSQHDWEHCVPKERAGGPRISLAFRAR